MSTNPYQSPETIDTPMATLAEISRDKLLSIARWQKGVLYCILGQILLLVVNIALQIAAVQPGAADPPFTLGIFIVLSSILLVLVGVGSIVSVFGLAIKVYNAAVGVILGLLTFLPLIGFIVMLVVNGKATKTLKRHGIRVGLMGARLSDI